MKSRKRLSRRQFSVAIAGAAAVAIAGCADDGDEPTDDDGANGNNDGANGASGDDAPAEIDDFLASAQLYDGAIHDATGQDEVAVDVGAGSDGLAYDPPALRIDAGTTVVWEWTGDGGGHDVTSTGDSNTEFASDLKADAGETFEHAFDDAGPEFYVCSPHETQGMLGAIEVV